MSNAAHRKALIHRLLKGLETGDPDAVAVVDESRYIQHNPQTAEGSVGLAELFARLAKTNPRVHLVRTFADGDFVFAHTEYDFATRRIGFEVFRFDGDRAVEHWDNIQPRRGPNPAGRSMVSGPTDAGPASATEATRGLARSFVEDALVRGQLDPAAHVVSDLAQHDPDLADGWAAWRDTLPGGAAPRDRYQRLHRVLADGHFALAVCEGERDGRHTAFYDLFRVQDGRIAERWNTVEAVAPRAEWKNDNGKF